MEAFIYNTKFNKRNKLLICLVSALLPVSTFSYADSDDKGYRQGYKKYDNHDNRDYKNEKYGSIATMPAKVKAECASCHMVYPSGLLVAKDWQRILNRLDKHYGTDASVSPQDLALITPYFVDNASVRHERHTSTTDLSRLTTTPWFKREHDKLPKDVYTHTSIKSATNCAACHTQAEKGSFAERQIRVPGYENRKW